MNFLFLSSGLFLGWSLGANDAANVFGSAVGSKMIRFRTAATLCGIFVIIGAVFSGAGTTSTLSELGSINALAGAFIVAFSAAAAVFSMTRLKMPVSTTQAIVGAIIGWNFFTSTETNLNSLTTIVATWFLSPVIAGVIAALCYLLARFAIRHMRIHLLRIDAYTRLGLIAIGIFGSYALGANNIANVMGVFVRVSPFADVSAFGMFTLTGTQLLFLLGGIAIAVGVFTYSKPVMETVGVNLMKLSPETALIVVFAHSMVLFLFASPELQTILLNSGLPAIPLVPVSSSQAIVGAIIGIGLLKGVREIRYGVIGKIALSWFIAPVLAGVISFFALFFMQNVFDQQVYFP